MLGGTPQPPCQAPAEPLKGELRTRQGAAGRGRSNGLEQRQRYKRPDVYGGDEAVPKDATNQVEGKWHKEKYRREHARGVASEVEEPEDVRESVPENDRNEERKQGEQRTAQAE